MTLIEKLAVAAIIMILASGVMGAGWKFAKMIEANHSLWRWGSAEANNRVMERDIRNFINASGDTGSDYYTGEFDYRFGGFMIDPDQ